MNDVMHETIIPKGALAAAIALVLFALMAATLARVTGIGRLQTTLPTAVESRDLRFEDGRDGAVLVLDARDDRVLDSLPSGSNGFVRVVMRGLARERRLGDVGSAPPFRLDRFANGQFTITDTATGKRVDLDAFGAANTQAFARLMNLGGT